MNGLKEEDAVAFIESEQMAAQGSDNESYRRLFLLFGTLWIANRHLTAEVEGLTKQLNEIYRQLKKPEATKRTTKKKES